MNEEKAYTCSCPDEIISHELKTLAENGFFKVFTDGDGKCGVHAVFGEASAEQRLKLHGCEAFIRSVFTASFTELKSKLHDVDGRRRIDDVVSNIWTTYVCTFFSMEAVGDEATVFHSVFM